MMIIYDRIDAHQTSAHFTYVSCSNIKNIVTITQSSEKQHTCSKKHNFAS